ncbi:MAG: TldD/PmbA family protein [Cellulosilyticaceae bacterium]
MFQFPEGLYTDVRIEDVFEGMTKYQNGMLKDNKHRKYTGALIRIFDGNKWYYSSTTAVDQINEEIASLAQMATPNPDINEHPLVKSLEVHQEEVYKYQEKSICKVTKDEQAQLLEAYGETVKKHEEVKEYVLLYKANAVVKSFYSSKGAKVVFDKQTCAIIVRYTLNIDGKRFDDSYDKTCLVFEDLKGLEDKVEEAIEVSKAYIKEAVPVEPGKYTVVFSPVATGVFAHESFGHKSEADSMLGSDAMKAEWTIGKQVGDTKLTIIDRGDVEGPGYTPFDDEGNRAKVNYLIKEGKLAGRLHTAATAQALEEVPTGNARGLNFEFEPIVRMTTTYIDKGDLTKEELFAVIEDGIYVEDISHGSGMTDFTIAPKRAYRIREGKIAEPVIVAVVTGNVMKTLYLIDGISNEVELLGFSGGGCGKMEQIGLPVGFGGPYIRVQNLDVQ